MKRICRCWEKETFYFTAILMCRYAGNMRPYTYLNPGSVSIPKEESAHSYMTYEDGLFQWKDLEGQVYMEYRI